MPLNIATTIIMTNPISTAVISRIILKEKMKYYDVISLISSLIGIIIITNPFQSTENQTVEQKNYFIGVCLGLSGIICMGFTNVFMRYMREGVHYSLSPFWFSCSCTLISPIAFTITNANQ